MFRTSLLVLSLTAAAATGLVGQSSDFDWRGRLQPGHTIEIRGVNGDIRAEASPDASVRVMADRHGRRSDPSSVRIEVVEHGGGVTICAVYPTPRNARQENECRPGGGTNNTSNNDVQVDFVVQVPANVRFAGPAGGIVLGSIAGASAGTTDEGTTGLLGGVVHIYSINDVERLGRTGTQG